MKSPVIKRSIMLSGHKTSVSLEDAFWQGLKEIAGHRNMSGSALIASIDGQRGEGNLSSAIRLFVLNHYRALAEHQVAEGTGAKTLHEPDVTPPYREAAPATLPGFRRWA